MDIKEVNARFNNARLQKAAASGLARVPIGVGSKLSRMLQGLGLKSIPGCKCKQLARSMDEAGIEWCEAHIPEIIGWLREEAERRKMPFEDFAGEILVRRAIKLARRSVRRSVAKTPR